MTALFCLMPYLLSAFVYLIPMISFLPFSMKTKEKLFLFFILLTNIFLIGFLFGNIGVIFLLLSSGAYIAYINSNRFINIGILIVSYLFCVLWDNIFSLIWDTFISPVATLRSFKHDYFNIMLSMSAYIEAGDTDGLKMYFEKEIAPLNKKLQSDTAHLNQLENLDIAELKSLVTAKLLYAAELNIQIQVEIPEKLSPPPVNTVDLTRILGIFLDNAIEAAIEASPAFIHFAAVSLTEGWSFVIENSYIDKGIPLGNLMKGNVSTKGSNRGIGLHNAQKLIAQYDHVFLETESRSGIFTQKLQILRKS